ncbi:hypothetical protein L7F22_027795 [Adiantum nelumboides]|nr:hypothetical protein [Adiantum nelumboides]
MSCVQRALCIPLPLALRAPSRPDGALRAQAVFVYRRERFPSFSLKGGKCGVIRNEGALTQEAEKLKAELLEAIDAAEGSLDDACLAVVSSLEELKSVPNIAADPGIIKGCLVGVKANFKENRRDKQERHLGYLGARSSLGSLTFNVFKPVDLQIALYNMYQHVAMENADSYSLITEFSIVDPSAGDAPLQGLIVNRCRYSVGGSNRLLVKFVSCEMRPRFSEKAELTAWLKTLKEANPGMDESGCAVVPFPMPIKGWSDVLYMDDEMRIQKGNKGGVSVLKLLKEPVVSI